MYFSVIKLNDVANGTGVRTTIFVSGCRNKCKDCFQPQTWDFKFGKEFTEETINFILDSLKPDYVNGLTVLGGEPFEEENQKDILKLLKIVKEKYPNKNIWCFTGYLYDKDLCYNGKKYTEFTEELLSYIDVLVDGPFKTELKNLSLKFRGSSNQRLINLKQMRDTNSKEIIILD